MSETFYATICFGFVMEKDKTTLNQMWVDQWGNTEWRPVPMIEVDKKRPDSIAGYLQDEDDREET